MLFHHKSSYIYTNHVVLSRNIVVAIYVLFVPIILGWYNTLPIFLWVVSRPGSQMSTSRAFTWIWCKLGKQYLVKKSNPGPTPIYLKFRLVHPSVHGLRLPQVHLSTLLRFLHFKFSMSAVCFGTLWWEFWRLKNCP